MRSVRNVSFVIVLLLSVVAVGQQDVRAGQYCDMVENTLTAFLYSEGGGFTEQEAIETCDDIHNDPRMCSEICEDVCQESVAQSEGNCLYFPQGNDWGVDIQCPCNFDVVE